MKRPKNTPRSQSIGEMISTLVYIGMGLWLLSAALVSPIDYPLWKKLGFISAVACHYLPADVFSLATFGTNLRDAPNETTTLHQMWGLYIF